MNINRIAAFFAVPLICAGLASADNWDFTYTASDFVASGVLQTQTFGGDVVAISGKGTLTYDGATGGFGGLTNGATGNLTLIPNPCFGGAIEFPGEGCSGSPQFTLHPYPDSGGGDLIADDLVLAGDGEGLAFTITGGITGGFNPWNNQSAFFGNGEADNAAGGVLTFTAAPVPEPMSLVLLGTLLFGVGIVGRRSFSRQN